MILRDEAGHELLDLIQGDEAMLCGPQGPKPLTHALVLARKEGKTLFVFNRFKKIWELPGGLIESGESAGEAALRELMEEANQTLPELGFRGLMHFKLQPEARVEFGALFAGTVIKWRPFSENPETESAKWWDGQETLEPMAGIDRWLALNIP